MATRKSPLRMALVVMLTCGAIAGGLYKPLTASAQAAASAGEPVARNSFADIFERVSPAVVNISVTQKASVRPMAGAPNPGAVPFGSSPFEEFFGQFFGRPDLAPRRGPSRALGSGLILDSDGYVVTNNHVIDGAESIVVTLDDGTELDATLIGTDPKTDIALLKISPDKPLTAVTLGDSDAARVGDWVLAIGNPFGLGGTATFGIISAIGRDIQSGPYDNFLQIDAPINSGNSGGPVFNVAGEVIGVNTAIYSPNGGNVGIGFAIPAAQVRKVAQALKEDGHVTRGWLGVQIQEIDDDLAESLGVSANSGALVADVVKGSPADKADIRVGDVITRFDGKAVSSPKALSRLVADANPSTVRRVDVLRNGRPEKLSVKLGDSESPVTLAAAGGRYGSSQAPAEKLGLALAPLNDSIRAQLGLGDDVKGLVVTDVDPDSDAAGKGIRRGDLIVSVDGKSLRSLADFEAAIAGLDADDKSLRMLVRRGDSQRFVAVGLA